MNRKKLINILVACLALGIGTSAASTVEARSYHSSYTTRHSIVYKNKNATLRITKAQGFLAKNGHYAPEHQILLYGALHNNSSHGITANNFWDKHFRAFQVTHTTWHELDLYGGASIYDSTKHIESLENKADDHVRPHRTVHFILVDEDGLSFWQGQKIAVRTYNDAYYEEARHLATKKFSLDVYGYRAKQLAKQRKIKQEKAAAKKHKQEVQSSKNFYKKADKYDVYWGNNADQYKLHGYESSGKSVYIRGIGYFDPLVMKEDHNQIHLCIYFNNTSNQTISIFHIIGQYFDIMDADNKNKLNFRIDDIKRYDICKPHKNSAVTLLSTNNTSTGSGLHLVVKNNYSTNHRDDYEPYATK